MTETTREPENKLGEILALVVGAGLVLVGGVNVLCGGEIVVTTILVLIGAGALSGWAKARQQRLITKDDRTGRQAE